MKAKFFLKELVKMPSSVFLFLLILEPYPLKSPENFNFKFINYAIY